MAHATWISLLSCPIFPWHSYFISSLMTFLDINISFFILWLSSKKALFINSNLSSKGLSLIAGISITIGILLLKVNKRELSTFSVVAAIIITLLFLTVSLSPSLLNIPLSNILNSISCPSDGNLWISSKNKIPPSQASTIPILFSVAPV